MYGREFPNPKDCDTLRVIDFLHLSTIARDIRIMYTCDGASYGETLIKGKLYKAKKEHRDSF